MLWQSQHSVLSALRAAGLKSPDRLGREQYKLCWSVYPLHKVWLALASTGSHGTPKHTQLRMLRLASVQNQNGQSKGFWVSSVYPQPEKWFETHISQIRVVLNILTHWGF